MISVVSHPRPATEAEADLLRNGILPPGIAAVLHLCVVECDADLKDHCPSFNGGLCKLDHEECQELHVHHEFGRGD